MADINPGDRVVVIGPGDRGIVNAVFINEDGERVAEVRLDYWPDDVREFQFESLALEESDG